MELALGTVPATQSSELALFLFCNKGRKVRTERRCGEGGGWILGFRALPASVYQDGELPPSQSDVDIVRSSGAIENQARCGVNSLRVASEHIRKRKGSSRARGKPDMKGESYLSSLKDGGKEDK